MTRETSKDAYCKIKESGLLGQRQMQAYEVLYLYGPLTASEVWDIVKKKYGIMISSQGAGSRLSELRDRGVIDEVGFKKDSITKMQVILWDVNGKLPNKTKRNQRRNRIEIARQQEREACARIAYKNNARKIGDLIMGIENKVIIDSDPQFKLL